MKKKEIIWREILYQAINNKNTEFTQKDLAKKFSFSLSTVFNALKVPRQSGAINVSGRNFRVLDSEKFLNIWATFRNLKNDIIYKTNISESARKTEGFMVPEAAFGAYSAYVFRYKDAPADYDKVYVYAEKENLEEIKKRFPLRKGNENLFVLEKDDYFENYGNEITSVQLYVDLWNLSDWYVKDYLNSLKNKMFG